MLIIGLVGGIGSGKSKVADFLRQMGAEVIDADRIGHEVIGLPEVVAALRDRWGEKILADDGSVNRRKVAEIVFAAKSGGEELRFLESVTHPHIEERILLKLRQFDEQGKVPVVVLDAAILVEAGWARHCHKIVFVDADREQRLQRIYQRGWTAADLADREAMQISLEEKTKLADWVIDNSGSFDHTFAQVQQFWRALDLSPPD